MKKLTKTHIEQFAYEIMEYLIKHELDMDVNIYYNNKRIQVNLKGLTPCQARNQSLYSF